MNQCCVFLSAKFHFVSKLRQLATLNLKVTVASREDMGNLGPSSVFSANSKNTSPLHRLLSRATLKNLVDILAMTLIKKPWLYSSR